MATAGHAPRDDGLNLAPLRAALAAEGVLIGARRIRPGDEAAFADPELSPTPASLARRRASGAARIVARRIIGELGADARVSENWPPLTRDSFGAPRWPDGIVGSLAHDEAFAVAAAARRGNIAGLGVDIERAEPLPTDLVEFVLSGAEKRMTEGDGVTRRLVFASKEAVYKAIHPVDGTPLEYADIEIRLAEGMAALRDGRRLRLVTTVGARLIAVAMAAGQAAKS